MTLLVQAFLGTPALHSPDFSYVSGFKLKGLCFRCSLLQIFSLFLGVFTIIIIQTHAALNISTKLLLGFEATRVG